MSHEVKTELNKIYKKIGGEAVHIFSNVCCWVAKGCTVIVLEIPTTRFYLWRWSPETTEMGYFRAEADGIS
jgi:hypothetical protein